jgi:polar amino acid transport system substrate-binding protein
MKLIGRQTFGVWIALALLLTFTGAAAADTLKRVQDSGVIRIGYRADALPHSYSDSAGRPAGYIVDICREVVAAVQEKLKPSAVRADFVVVTAQDRFEAVRDNRIDLLCEPSSVTMSRREIVDFSIPTFVDGAGVAFRGKEIDRFEDFAGRKVGVLQGTTSFDLLRSTLLQLGIKGDIVVATDHRSGMGMLADGKIDAYFADRAILAYFYGRLDKNRNIKIGSRYFSYETYGLALQRGDTDFRWLVDRTLARMARDGRIDALASKNFGGSSDELLRAMTVINSLPD